MKAHKLFDYKMKKKELQDLQTKEVAELQKMLFEKKAEIGKLKLELSTGKHKNVRVVTNTRRELRQIATVLNQKKEAEKLVVSEVEP